MIMWHLPAPVTELESLSLQDTSVVDNLIQDPLKAQVQVSSSWQSPFIGANGNLGFSRNPFSWGKFLGFWYRYARLSLEAIPKIQYNLDSKQNSSSPAQVIKASPLVLTLQQKRIKGWAFVKRSDIHPILLSQMEITATALRWKRRNARSLTLCWGKRNSERFSETGTQP